MVSGILPEEVFTQVTNPNPRVPIPTISMAHYSRHETFGRVPRDIIGLHLRTCRQRVSGRQQSAHAVTLQPVLLTLINKPLLQFLQRSRPRPPPPPLDESSKNFLCRRDFVDIGLDGK